MRSVTITNSVQGKEKITKTLNAQKMLIVLVVNDSSDIKV